MTLDYAMICTRNCLLSPFLLLSSPRASRSDNAHGYQAMQLGGAGIGTRVCRLGSCSCLSTSTPDATVCPGNEVNAFLVAKRQSEQAQAKQATSTAAAAQEKEEE